MRQRSQETSRPFLQDDDDPSSHPPNASQWDGPEYTSLHLASQGTHHEGATLTHGPLQSRRPESSYDQNQTYHASLAGSSGDSTYTALPSGIAENGSGSIENPPLGQKPKRVIRTGWTRNLYRMQFHIPAICSSVAAVVVGMIPFYWYPEEGAIIGGELVRADIIANSLQLAGSCTRS